MKYLFGSYSAEGGKGVLIVQICLNSYKAFRINSMAFYFADVNHFVHDLGVIASHFKNGDYLKASNAY